MCRLDLPIDHFRLLGVGPTSDAQTVLRTLQQRIDRAPDQGFTLECLQARAELLRASADLLSDPERREAYEAELTSLKERDASGAEVIAALEIPSSKEVGALLLLLEAGQPLEAFELACRGLEPPQAPALGSSREADLTLVAALACQEAAADFERQRRYESAGMLLQKGLLLLQRMGQLPELRQQLHQRRERLLPYRVLDLLSRDPTSGADRREGLELLELLLRRRGGLEGQGDPSFPSHEFQAFFGQIRPYLTVQEQIDLFQRWADAGSTEAQQRIGTALVASGFAQRKPERLAAAADQLRQQDRPEAQMALEHLQLLLGEVTQLGTPLLASRCGACRLWLQQEVLPGYRDIEREADLDAWFADRDVQAWIESQDRRQARQTAARPSEGSGEPPGQPSWPPAWGTDLPAAEEPFGSFDAGEGDAFDGEELEDGPADGSLQRSARRLRRQAVALGERRSLWIGAGIALVLGLVWGGLRAPRQAQRPASTPIVRPAAPAARKPPTPAPLPPAPPRATPLTAAEPSAEQLRNLLTRWLNAKASVLAGRQASEPLQQLATPRLVQRLEADRRRERSLGHTQRISSRIINLEVLETYPDRIVTAVVLDYSDSTLNAAGSVISRTPPRRLQNLYVFTRSQGQWQLAKFKPRG